MASKTTFRMEYAISYWHRPCFNCEGKYVVDETDIYYCKRKVMRMFKRVSFDSKDCVVCRRRGSNDKWRKLKPTQEGEKNHA